MEEERGGRKGKSTVTISGIVFRVGIEVTIGIRVTAVHPYVRVTGDTFSAECNLSAA